MYFRVFRIKTNWLTSHDSRVNSVISSPSSIGRPSYTKNNDHSLEQKKNLIQHAIWMFSDMITFVWPPFTHSVSIWINSKPRKAICSSFNSPYRCGTQVLRKRYNSSVRFFGILNQNSGRSLFLPYDTILVGDGMGLPTGLPIRKRKYNGGSAQARAGRGINSRIIRRILLAF